MLTADSWSDTLWYNSEYMFFVVQRQIFTKVKGIRTKITNKHYRNTWAVLSILCLSWVIEWNSIDRAILECNCRGQHTWPSLYSGSWFRVLTYVLGILLLVETYMKTEDKTFLFNFIFINFILYTNNQLKINIMILQQKHQQCTKLL